MMIFFVRSLYEHRLITVAIRLQCQEIVFKIGIETDVEEFAAIYSSFFLLLSADQNFVEKKTYVISSFVDSFYIQTMLCTSFLHECLLDGINVLWLIKIKVHDEMYWRHFIHYLCECILFWLLFAIYFYCKVWRL